MKKTSLLYPKGKTKAITFSYDDGVTQDIRLSEMFRKHNLKCTFNINSSKALSPEEYENRGVKIINIPSTEFEAVYKSHEIATHSYTHPHLTRIHEKQIFDEIYNDRLELEKITGKIVRGHAYPYGSFNENVIKVLENNYIAYARTTQSTNNFDFPKSFLEWHPTCHHNSPMLFDLLNNFINSKRSANLFYIWGHSYEFDMDDNWEVMEEFCAKASNLNDVWYATNIEIYDYIKSYRSLIYSADSSIVYNPSSQSVFLGINTEVIELKSGETYEL
jgi:hypothetical protein